MDNKRNGAIDLLKFLFGLMVVFYHGRKFVGSERMLFGAGFIAVEFFFLVSGYLMAAKAYSVSKKENLLPGKETSDYILKKVKTLFPHVLFAYILSLAVHFLITSDLVAFTKKAVFTVWEPFMLWMSGLGTNEIQINAQAWYISAMLLAMLVLYPIMIKKFDLFTRVIAPIAAIFIFGWISHEYGTLNHYRGWSGILYSGNLRAFAVLSLGAVCWQATQWLIRIPFTKLGRGMLSLVEVTCYLLVVVGANLHSHKALSFVMVAFLAVGITITFSKKSLTGTCFDKKICYWLGNFSLTVYLQHIMIRKYFEKNDLGLSYHKELLIFIGIVLVWSLIAHFLMQGIQKLSAIIWKKVKPALVESNEVPVNE